MYSLPLNLDEAKEVLRKNPNYISNSYKMSEESSSFKSLDSYSEPMEEELPSTSGFQPLLPDPQIISEQMIKQGEAFDQMVERERERGKSSWIKLPVKSKTNPPKITSKRSLNVTPDEDKWTIIIDLQYMDLDDRDAFLEESVNNIKLLAKGNDSPVTVELVRYDQLRSQRKLGSAPPMDIDRSEEPKHNTPRSDINIDQTKQPGFRHQDLYNKLKKGLKLPSIINPGKYYTLKIGKDGLDDESTLDLLMSREDETTDQALRGVISRMPDRKEVLNLYAWKKSI